MTTTHKDWTVGGLLDWTAKFFQSRGAEYPRLDAEVLLAHALGCERIHLYTRYDESASEASRQAFRELVRKRVEGCPVAYLVGRKEFYSLRFSVSPAVLIPRPDTECLVDECLRLAKPLPEPAVLDVGTGSGCIAVTVAKQLRTATVTATDLSPEALAVAHHNAERHAVHERIRFLSGDLYEPLPNGERFDFILSNPPYVANEELPKLPIGVRDYEPRLALDGGPGGYVIVDRLLDGAAAFLNPDGYLIIEIGNAQESHVRDRLEELKQFEVALTIVDHSGHPRVVQARRK